MNYGLNFTSLIFVQFHRFLCKSLCFKEFLLFSHRSVPMLEVNMSMKYDLFMRVSRDDFMTLSWALFYIKSFLSPKGAHNFLLGFLLDYQIHSYTWKIIHGGFCLKIKLLRTEVTREGETKDIKYGNLVILERIKKRFRETFEKFKRVSLVKHVSLSLSFNE